MVVVQNPGSILPLKSQGVKYALIGPLANITDPFLGDYRPAACPNTSQPAPQSTSCLPTLVELFAAKGLDVAFTSGCADPPCSSAPDLASVSSAMAGADVVVLVIGEKVTDHDSGGNTGGEGKDRDSIGLPGKQAELVAAALATKKPVVAVIISGGSVSVDSLKSASNAAVVYPGYGGETGQNAIVDVLFGDAPASGRLAHTVYPESWGNATLMADMSFQARPRCHLTLLVLPTEFLNHRCRVVRGEVTSTSYRL